MHGKFVNTKLTWCPEWIDDNMHPHPKGYELLDFVVWATWYSNGVREKNPQTWAKRPTYQRRLKHLLHEVVFTSINGEKVAVPAIFCPKELHDFCRVWAFPKLTRHFIPTSWTEERLKVTPLENRFIY